MTTDADALHVLFIDDEQPVLDGIARVLRRHKPGWSVQYVSNPVEALKIYKRDMAVLDAVVCDINMPIVSGLQIMQAITEHSPRIVRIALSGQLDIKAMIGTSKYADCHICKPVKVEALCERLVELCRARAAAPPTPPIAPS